MEHEYKGIPIGEVRIDRIRWTDSAAEHIRTRRERKGSPSEIDLEPEWATEAALDTNESWHVQEANRLKSLAGQVSLNQDQNTLGLLIKVWLIPEDLSEGAWFGASACAANRGDRRAYEEVNT